MASTIADVILTNSGYQDLYAATSIAVGTALFIQNKGTAPITIQLKGFQPASSSADGVQLQTYDFFVVDVGEAGVWAKGSGRLCVQVV
jgi:hypothetical protein